MQQAGGASSAQFIKMTQTPIPKLIVTLAAPTVASMLVSSIYNLADTFFVGRKATAPPARWAWCSA